MADASAPIGIFDSGIGGLTVAAAIHSLLPNENLIYVGDTAHFPYGDKSAGLIEQYGTGIARYLLERKCKMIVIACNTASAYAYKAVQALAGDEVPVINVIDPAAEAIAKQFPQGKIGLIATRGTVSSGIYPRKIKKQAPKAEVTSLATPLLAPMIEEGFFNNKISRTIIHSYLEKKSLQGIDAIILGCTHYPLIRPEIESFYKGSITVFDSAEMVAAKVMHELQTRNLLHAGNADMEFYVSDYTETFASSANYFFPEKVELKKLDLW
ncbi:MAG: glutamate racemase [Bacteroidia bacterium]|jgi:glutamate racemase